MTENAPNPEPADIEVYLDGNDLSAEMVNHDFSSSAAVEIRLPLRHRIMDGPELYTVVAVVPDKVSVILRKKR
jgi:hypothetical protein